jgi:hypothetical protein
MSSKQTGHLGGYAPAEMANRALRGDTTAGVDAEALERGAEPMRSAWGAAPPDSADAEDEDEGLPGVSRFRP